MNRLKRVTIKISIYVLTILSLSFMFVSCSNKKINSKVPSNEESINLNKGSVLLEENGTYKVKNLVDNSYQNIKSDNVIINYNKESGTYVYTKEGKHFIVYDGNQIEIKDSNYNFIKLSDDGKYASYMSYDNGYKLKVISLENNKEVNIKSNVVISGNLYDFISNDRLVYYGVSNSGENGIFTYDLKSGKEELLYKLQGGGYVGFLKGNNDSVFILKQKSEMDREIIEINSNDKSANIISKDFKTVNDLEKLNGSYYILGEPFDNSKSLYEVKNNKLNRLVYSFPPVIDMEKGIEVSGDNIVFVGSNTTLENEEVFSYKDNSVSIISSKEGIYNFINVN